MPADGAGGRRRLIQQKRNRDIAMPSQSMRIETLRLMPAPCPGCPPVDYVVNDGAQIKFFTVQFVVNTRQVFRLHHLKLMTNRRDHAFVAFARFVHKSAVTMLYLLLNDAAP